VHTDIFRSIRYLPNPVPRGALEIPLPPAAFLGLALLLKVKVSAHSENQDSHSPSRITSTVASLLQAIGIGSLLPLPGFLLLVLGDAVASLFL
jgi:hypothetical protein